MASVRFDTYYRYADLSRVLQELAREHPQLVRLSSIGRSYEGRDIWLATVTNSASGPDREKPALWVDGNIHATEVAGSMACLYLLQHLLDGYGRDADITRCLDTRVFYVCPRLNPDGAEWALADVPRLIRSSTRPYPYDEEPIGGLMREDVDGDGRVLTMRIPDPNGPWKVSERDPRLLVRRDPTETGGSYYRLLPEGRVEDYDGVIIKLQPRKEQLDLNRNFPAGWRQEHEQFGAGPFPGLRAGSARGGELHRGPSQHHRRGRLPHLQRRAAAALLAPGRRHACRSKTCGPTRRSAPRAPSSPAIPNISVFHDFRYHPKEVITGSLRRLDVRAWRRVRLDGGDLEPAAPGRHRRLQVHRVVPRASGRGRSEAAEMERRGAGRARGSSTGTRSSIRSSGAVELGGWDTPVYLEQPAARAAREGDRALPEVAGLAAADLAAAGDARSHALCRSGTDTWRVRLVVHNTRLAAQLRHQAGCRRTSSRAA